MRSTVDATIFSGGGLFTSKSGVENEHIKEKTCLAVTGLGLGILSSLC